MIFTNTQKQSSFAAGAAILALSAITVKLIGVCYKIPLVHLLGAQGMGYFNAAYDVYALLCVISTTGLPIAVSVVINRYPSAQRKIYLLSLSLFAVFGCLGAAGVFLGADMIAQRVGAPGAAQSLRFIAPAVLFICLSGAFRGYYQAKRNMKPTAISQIVEAAGKLLFGLVFAHVAIRLGGGSATAAAFAVLGLSVGTLLSLLYLAFADKNRQNSLQSDRVAIVHLLKELLIVAFPVTLGAIMTGLSKVIDLSLIMRRLQDGGISQDSAVALYGCYSSMVVPLFNVIPALLGSLTMPLVPHLGHAIANHDREEQTNILSTAFRWGITVSIPAALGMGMLSKQILAMLFSDAAEIQTAVPLLMIACMAVPASCIMTATSAVLQAYGHAWLPMLSTAIGCVFKAICLYVLCAQPDIGILAAPMSTWLCCTVTVMINLIFVAKFAPSFDFAKRFAQALAAACVAVGVAARVYCIIAARLSSFAVGIGMTIAVAVLLYIPIAYLCGMIRISDIKSMISNKEKEF